jgi:hypothetical protein
VESEFEHDVGAMSFGGVDADAEEGGDFFVALALGEELQDFAFARSEVGVRGFGRLGRVSGIGGGRDACREVRLVTAKGIDGRDEDAVGAVFEDVAAGAGFDHLLNEIFGLVHGEDEDFGVGRRFANAASGVDTVEERHTNVEDRDVRFVLGSFVSSFAAVSGGFGANFPTGMRFNERAQPGANRRVVIRDEDAKRQQEKRMRGV